MKTLFFTLLPLGIETLRALLAMIMPQPRGECVLRALLTALISERLLVVLACGTKITSRILLILCSNESTRTTTHFGIEIFRSGGHFLHQIYGREILVCEHRCYMILVTFHIERAIVIEP